jgi:hypothetical protein
VSVKCSRSTPTINILLTRIRLSLKLNRSEQHSDNKGNSHCSLRKERQGDVGVNILHVTPSSDEPTGNLDTGSGEVFHLLKTLSHKFTITILRRRLTGSIRV